MGWMTTAILLVGLQCITTSLGLPPQFAGEVDALDDYYDATGAAAGNIDVGERASGSSGSVERRQEEQLVRMSDYLAEMLRLPSDGRGLPLLYIEEDAPPAAMTDEDLLAVNEDYPALSASKRSRFYRKYPWKRQNRQSYDAENRYLCQPSREDVYRLLVALHDSRQGGQGRNVHFCNRKRPAKAIFTNIRFMG